MFLVGLGDRLKNAADFFSIGLLVRTIFSPFRQISGVTSDSPAFSAQVSRFFDRLLSRMIGAIIRIGLLIIGTFIILLQAIFGALLFLLWPVIPFMIIGCVVLAFAGVAF